VLKVTIAIRLSFNGLKPGSGRDMPAVGRAFSMGAVVSVVSKRKKSIRRITTTIITMREGSKNLRGKACLVGE